MKKSAAVFLLCAFLFAVNSGAAAIRVLYVKAGASSAGANGQSWSTAFPSLDQALTAVDSLSPVPSADNKVEIWVTSGTFKPDPSALTFPENGDFSNATFKLRSWTAIIGGFNATTPESSVDGRSPFNPMTVLSGDWANPLQSFITPSTRGTIDSIAKPDPADAGFSGNSYTVVSAKNVVGAVLDTVVVSGGYAWNFSIRDSLIEEMSILGDDELASSSGATIRHDVAGGGIYVENATPVESGWNLALNNVLVTQNFARGYGGGLAAIRSTVVVGNCDFVANRAHCDGGAVWGRGSLFKFSNTTFLRNDAGGTGGAVHLEASPVMPEGWENTPAAKFLGGDAATFGKIVDSSLKAYKFADALYTLSSLGFTDGLIKMMPGANPMGALAFMTLFVMTTDSAVLLARHYGDNSEFVRYWAETFSPNFKKYATPEGWGTLLAEEIIKVIAPDYYDMKYALRSLQSRARASEFFLTEFRENKAGSAGGAIRAQHVNLHIERSVFTGNDAKTTAGAVYQTSFCYTDIYSSAFHNNSSAGHSALLFSGSTKARVINCTIVDNISTTAGGRALATEMGSDTLLYNSILWGNKDPAPATLAGGADIYTANRSRLDANTGQLYDDNAVMRFRYIGVTDAAYCNIQSLSSITNDWGDESIRFYYRYPDGFFDFVERLLPAGKALDEHEIEFLKSTGAYDWYNVQLTGEGTRVSDRNNVSIDPLLHSGWIPGVGSPILDLGCDSLVYNRTSTQLTLLDLLGQSRFDGPAVAIGAIERGIPPTTATGETPGRIFVRATATGDGSGRNWNNATADLKAALAATNSEVWVTAGTYTPTSTGDRSASFTLGEGTRAYGGFAGTETTLEARSPALFPTTLSGDLGGGTHSYHVVRHASLTAGVVLDGFTISGGRADGSTDEDRQGGGVLQMDAPITIRGCIVRDNYAGNRGAGIYSQNARLTQLADTVFENNEATAGGGAFVIGEVAVDRCTFTANKAGQAAALMLQQKSSKALEQANGNVRNSVFSGNLYTGFDATNASVLDTSIEQLWLYNCTFYGNHTVNVVRATGTQAEMTEVRNCIFYENRGPGLGALSTEAQLVTKQARVTVNNCDIQGAIYYLSFNDYNVDVDPQFVNAAAGDFRLSGTSPLIDAGQAPFNPLYAADRAGNARVFGPSVDIGAYESQGGTSYIAATLRLDRTIASAGPVYTFTPVPALPLATSGLTYEWRVNKGDGNGSVVLDADSRISGLGTPILTIAQPPAEWENWVFTVVVSGSTPSSAFKALTGVRGNKLYVNAAATGTGDGLSWANAHTTLEKAIANANDYAEIWVAKGTYRPSASQVVTTPYRLRQGLVIYGGFAGTETTRDARNVALNPTILSGAYSTPLDAAMSANYLVTFTAQENRDAALPCVLDGFTLTTARYAVVTAARAAPFTVANCTIENPLGAGVFALPGATLTLRDSSLQRTTSGALHVTSATVALERCLVVQNESHRAAALDIQSGATVTLNHSTIADNFASGSPGGISVSESTLTIDRSILWGNRDYASDAATNLESAQLTQDRSAVAVTSSLIEDLTTLIGTGSNQAYHPLFADPGSLDYTLLSHSPAIGLDAGARPYVGTPANPLVYMLSVSGSRTERLSPTTADFSASWLPTGASADYTISWQVDLGSGWVGLPAAGLVGSVDTSVAGVSKLTVTKTGGAVLPSFRIRGVMPSGLTLPIANFTVVAPAIRYVNAARASNGDGLSWATAYRDVPAALTAAVAGTELWVARGTYDYVARQAMRLKPQVAIVGGFVGTETSRSQRSIDPANPTLILGSFAVAFSDGSFGRQVLLDGLTVQAPAQADKNALALDHVGGVFQNCIFTHGAGTAITIFGGSPGFQTCTFNNSTGGAVSLRDGVGRFISCRFESNRNDGRPGGAIDATDAGLYIDRSIFLNNRTRGLPGGAISSSGGNLAIANSLFVGNYGRQGGAIAVMSGSLVARNLTLTNNRSDLFGAIHGYAATLDVANSILWDNAAISSASAAAGRGVNLSGAALIEAGQLYGEAGSTITARHDVIEGLTAFAGSNNIGYAPLFSGDLVSPYGLSPSSPAVGAADLALLQAVAPVSAFPGRLSGGSLDIGAYEYSAPLATPVQLTAAPGPFNSMFSGASPTFTVSGAAGVGTTLVWQHYGVAGWADVSGTAWQTSNTSTTATLTVDTSKADAAGLYRYRIGSFTSPGFTVDVKARRVVYLKPNGDVSATGASWATAFGTFTQVLALEDPGVEVRMAAGTYALAAAVHLKPGFLFLGGFPADGSVTDPALRNPALNVTKIAGENLLEFNGSLGEFDTDSGLDGLVLETAGTGNVAISVVNGASPRIRNCILQGTSVGSLAVASNLGAAPLFEDCRFLNNLGPVLDVRGDASLRIVRGTFTGNQGGILVASSALDVSIEDSLLDQNPVVPARASALLSTLDSHVSLSRTRVTNHSSVPALRLSGGSLTVSDSLFAHNALGAMFVTRASASLRHVTVVDNQTDSSEPAGLFLGDSAASADIRNSIFWGNRATSKTRTTERQQIDLAAGATLVLSHSTVEGLATFTGTGASALNPLFVDQEGANYALVAHSPAVNTAGASYTTAGDLLGTARQGAPDRGAYEFAGTAATALQILTLPVDSAGYVRTTASFPVVGSAGLGPLVQWWKWDGTQRVPLPTDARLSIVVTDTSSTLSLSDIAMGDTSSYVFTVSGTTYQSPVYTLTPTSRLIRYVVSGPGAENADGQSWGTAWRSLEKALTDAPEGAEIWVFNGSYSLNQSIALRRGVELVGGFTTPATDRSQRSSDASKTIIRGQFQNFATAAKPIDATAVLDGFTLIYENNIPMINRGGASPTLRNCIIRDSLVGVAVESGGGTFDNCVFRDIDAVGLQVQSGASVVTVTNAEFVGTTEAVRAAGGVTTISRSLFHDNVDSAASLVSASASAQVVLDRAQFYANSSAPILRTSGSALLTLRNSLIHDNTTLYYGVVEAVGGTTNVTQSTLYGNLSGNHFTAGLVARGGALNIKNSIVWHNRLSPPDANVSIETQQVLAESGTVQVDHSIIEGLTSLGGAGNLGQDPLFNDAGAGVFTLSSISPAINAGDGTLNQTGYALDLADAARVNHGTPDLGAYEFSGTVDTPLRLVRSPASTLVAPGDSAQFVVEGLSLAGSSVMWEVETAPGVFSALPGDGAHTVTVLGNVSTLTVGPVTAAFDGKRYRFRIASPAISSAPVTLSIGRGQVLYVSGFPGGADNGTSWTNAYHTIAQAVAAWTPGTEIWVVDNTYTLSSSLALQSGMKIYGGFRGTESQRNERAGTTATYITGASLAWLVNNTATLGRDTVIDSFYFKNAQGGIYNQSASPTISNCTFDGFSAGAAARNFQAAPLYTGCTFRNNALVSLLDDQSSSEVASCRFEDNRHTNFINTLGGSALRLQDNRTNGEMTQVRDTVFVRCSDTAVYVGGSVTVRFDRCQWLDNTTTESPVLLSLSNSNVEVRNSLVARNRATARQGVLTTNGAFALRNVTLADNTAFGLTDAVLTIYGAAATIDNSILWGNRSTNGGGLPLESQLVMTAAGGSVSIRTSIVEGLSTYAGNSNQACSPLFDQRPSYKYQLTRFSPAVDVGNNANAILPATDLAQNNRQVGANVDLGAFELSDLSGAAAVRLLVDPADAATNRTITTWPSNPGTLTLQGLSGSSISWETWIGDQWITLPSGGVFAATSTATSATLAVASTAETDADRLVRFRIAGTDYVSPTYTFTTRGQVFFVRAEAPAGGDGSGWSKAFRTISQAVTAAPANSEIWVAVGTYTENVRPKPALRIYGGFFGNETLRSQRAGAATATVVAGPANQPALSLRTDLAPDASTVIDRFQFVPSSGQSAVVCSSGAGAVLRNTYFSSMATAAVQNYGGTLVVEDSEFSSNTKAIEMDSGTLTVRRSLFQNNKTAVYLAGTTLIEDCRFLNNVAPTSGDYGAGYIFGASVIRRTTFSGNVNTFYVPLVFGPASGIASTATLSDCSFTGNVGGFGACVQAFDLSSLLVERCAFTGNAGARDSSTTGALEISGSPATVRDSYFANNSTTGVGAAIATKNSSPLVFTGLTVVDNIARRYGGISIGNLQSGGGAPSVTLVNSILWGNRGSDLVNFADGNIEKNQLQAVTTAHHAIIEGLSTYTGVALSGYDPRLVTVDGRKVPGADSPALNAGDNTVVAVDAIDLTGAARIVATTVDLGAIESTATALPPVLASGPIAARSAPGGFLEFVFAHNGRFDANFVTLAAGAFWRWDINTGSGWRGLTGSESVNQTYDATKTTLQLAWNPALQGAQVRATLIYQDGTAWAVRYATPGLAVDFGATPSVNGTVLASSPAPDSRATSTQPTVTLALSHALNRSSANAATLVVHGSQRGRLTGTKWGTLGTDQLAPALTPNVIFAAGENVEVTAAGLATALGGTFAPFVSCFSIPWTSRPGTFRQGASLAANLTGTITGVAASDLNGDGRTDVMFAGDNSAWIYLGDGMGGFTQLPLGFAGGWTAFAIADFDGDGRNDYVGSRNGTTLYVNTVNAASTAVASVFPAAPYAGTRLLPGDFNGDGRQDLLVLGPTSVDGELLLRNTGSGFTPAGAQRFGATEHTREAALADLDHDGDLDFVQVGATTGDIVVWLNDGAGNFTTGATIRVPNTQTIALTDVDGDGWTDLVIASGGTDTLHVWRNDHTGNFVHLRSFQAGPIVQLAAADFDGDGDNDVVTISGSAPDQLWRNDGSGGFSATTLPWTSTGASASSQLAVADLNNDGAPDLLLPQSARPIFWMPGIYFPGFAASLDEGGVKGFAATDFTSIVVANPGFTLTGFRVTALPAKGVLKLNGALVTLNQDLTLAQLGALTFTSTKDLYGADSFALAPRDSAGLSPSGRVALAINRVVDTPVANAQTISAFVQVPKTITLVGVHPENEAMTFTVTTLPAHGTLSGTGATRIYTANVGFLGTDTFVFRVSDNFGGSSVATVTINVVDNIRTVTTTADSGAGSLREQIAWANTQGGAWRIVFAAFPANPEIALSTAADTTSGPSAFLVTENIELDAGTNSEITLKRAPAVDELRFFRIAAGGRLALRGIRLVDGRIRGSVTPARGGALYNEGTLQLTNTDLWNNVAVGSASAGAEGGAVYSTGGALTVTDSSCAFNDAHDAIGAGTGGGFHIVAGDPIFTRVFFNGNVGPTAGADVQLVADDRLSSSRWVSTTVAGLGVARTGIGNVAITSRGSTLPSSLPAYVGPVAPQFITGDTNVPITAEPVSALIYYATGALPPSWLSILSTGPTTRAISFRPPEATSGALLLKVRAVSGSGLAYTYFEEFEANFAVPVSAAPTATDQQISTRNNQPKAFTLATTIASGLTATYTITDRPAKGVLSGTAPNLTYTPLGFAGFDEFVYTVTDSRGRSASAKVRIALEQTSFTVGSSEQLNAALAIAQNTVGDVTISLAASATNQILTLDGNVSTAFGPAVASIVGSVTIDGSAAPGVKLERSGAARRLFHIQPNGRLFLRYLTVSGGEAVGADGTAGINGGNGLGGIVYNSGGTFEAEFVTFTRSTARGGAGGAGGNGGNAFGGAIYNAAGTVLLSDSSFVDNFVIGGSGATTGVAEGGAIFSRNGAVSLTRTVFTYTQAIAFAHVSIFGDGAAATLTLDATPLSALTTATLNTGTAVINAGRSLVGGPGLTSIAPVSNFTISGVGTIPLSLANGPLGSLTVTSLDPAVLPNAWLSTAGSLSAPAVKVTTIAPAVGATATLRVTGIKDGTTFNRDVPVTLAAHVNPVALAQALTLQVNLAQPITLGATFPAGTTPAYTIVTPPAHGALSGTAPNLTYTPANGYLGNDAFTFRVTDDAGATSDATVTLTVQATGVPFFENVGAVTVAAKGQAFDIFSVANHSGGPSELAFLTFSLVTGQGPAHGTATVTNYEISPGVMAGMIHYEPTASTVGTDALTIRVTDRYGQTATRVYNLVLMDPATNTAPVITGLPSGVFAGSSTLTARPFAAAAAVDPESPPQNLFVEIPLPDATKGELVGFESLANVFPTTNYDPDSGDPIYSLAIIGTPAEITASLRVIGYHQTAALAPGQSNDVSLAVRISDDFTAATPTGYTFTLRITAPALPPVAGAASVTALMNNSVAITLAASHPQGLALVYTLPTPPQHGTLSGTMPNLIYTPASGYFGPDSFIYRVADVTGNFASATVSLFVNRRPVVIDDTLIRPYGQIAKVSIAALLANDSDPDGDAFSLVSIAATSTQGVALSAIDGWIYYPAPASLAANDTFTYTIRDARGATTTGTVNVVVQNPPATVRTVLSVTSRSGGRTGVTLRLAGVAGRSYTVQVSDDLITWTALATATADNLGIYTVDDSSAAAESVGRFYRAVKNN